MNLFLIVKVFTTFKTNADAIQRKKIAVKKCIKKPHAHTHTFTPEQLRGINTPRPYLTPDTFLSCLCIRNVGRIKRLPQRRRRKRHSNMR